MLPKTQQASNVLKMQLLAPQAQQMLFEISPQKLQIFTVKKNLEGPSSNNFSGKLNFSKQRVLQCFFETFVAKT